MSSKHRDNNEYNFWQPTSDMMTALLLIFLLIILLLGLFIVQIPEEEPHVGDQIKTEYEGIDEEGDQEDEEDDLDGVDDEGKDWHPYESEGAQDGEGDGTDNFEYPTTGGGGGTDPGEGEGDGVKSAVYVQIVDAETDRTIKEAGVTFELYGEDNGLQILNTYYPEKITYRNYATTEAGVFYLPEKIWQGEYYFHELTEPTGYDVAENQAFDLDDMYDWPEPFTVRIPLYPSKNIIRIQMNDKETGLPIAGGVFGVYAAEDIYTLDETLRYRSGQRVSTITCNAQGYGESKELYLGNYTVRQVTVPEYYASVDEVIPAEVNKKTKVEPAAHTVSSEKTKIAVRFVDELYESTGIEGVTFTISDASGNDAQTLTTDALGNAVATDLKKNTTYYVRQTEAPENYYLNQEEFTASVNTTGRIGDEITGTVTIPNRMLRVSVQFKEVMLNRGITGVRLGLYDSDGNKIKSWTTTGSAVTFTDISEGEYYVAEDGKEDKHYPLIVENKKDIQSLVIERLTITSVLAIAGMVLGGIGAIVLLFVILKKLRHRRKKKHD